MLDRRFVVEHADEVEQNCQRRGAPADVRQFNEKFSLADFHRGIKASAHLWKELGQLKKN